MHGRGHVLLTVRRVDGTRPEGDLRWPDFKRRVEWLIADGIIAPEKRHRWDTMRDLRNESTHASIRHLVMPIDVLRLLDSSRRRSTLCSSHNRVATPRNPVSLGRPVVDTPSWAALQQWTQGSSDRSYAASLEFGAWHQAYGQHAGACCVASSLLGSSNY